MIKIKTASTCHPIGTLIGKWYSDGFFSSDGAFWLDAFSVFDQLKAASLKCP
jgi:hypothetical protein